MSSHPQRLSLARISPLICTADALVAITTVVYGLNHNLGFRGSCTLFVRNTRRHLSVPLPELNIARFLVDFATFGLALYSAVTLFRAKGLDIRLTIWAAMYMGAPVISGALRLAAENTEAQQAVTQLMYNGHGTQVLRISDVIWCIAYSRQFTLWIQVFDAFSTLPRFADGNRKWFDLAMGASILSGHRFFLSLQISVLQILVSTKMAPEAMVRGTQRGLRPGPPGRHANRRRVAREVEAEPVRPSRSLQRGRQHAMAGHHTRKSVGSNPRLHATRLQSDAHANRARRHHHSGIRRAPESSAQHCSRVLAPNADAQLCILPDLLCGG